MMAMFSAIETLVGVARPRKVLFIAIDGVAPRAKMNQQRQRRFRAAQVAAAAATPPAGGCSSAAGTPQEEQEAVHGVDKKDEGDGSAPFDTNCITPGTEFMQRLDENLTYFIQRKLDEDADWRDLEVVLSGHRVPGEGEHKIMEFIRAAKSQPGYNPNTRHCLHGLDADLIMLALATHEPHFCILRERMILRNWRRNVINDVTSRAANFQQTEELQLLHIGLLRECVVAAVTRPCTHAGRCAHFFWQPELSCCPTCLPLRHYIPCCG